MGRKYGNYERYRSYENDRFQNVCGVLIGLMLVSFGTFLLCFSKTIEIHQTTTMILPVRRQHGNYAIQEYGYELEYEDEDNYEVDLSKQVALDDQLQEETMRTIAMRPEEFIPEIETRSTDPADLFHDLYAIDLEEGRGSLICERTIDVAYNRIDLSSRSQEKYFMYSPSGGFNNQRSELEYGVLITENIQRTLVVPMVGRHTTWWTRHADLSYDDLLPMDYIFDMAYFQQFHPNIVLTNSTIPDLEERLLQQARGLSEPHLFKELRPRRPEWSGKAAIRQHLGRYPDRMLFLKGSSMYRKWHSDAVKYSVGEKLIFNPCFRRYAAEIAKKLGPEFNAIHVRLGDYYKWGKVPSVRKLMAEMAELGFNESTPLYIATEPNRAQKFFAPLEAKYTKVFYSSDFHHVRHALKKQFKKPIVDDLLGVIEQLVCILANGFIGTYYSNFSKYISMLRKHSNTSFPEIKQIREQLSLK